MSLEQFSTFYIAGYYFGVEVSTVQEVIRYQEMTRVPLAHGVVSGLINLRGQIVTAIDLRKRLGLATRPPDMLPMNVVIRNDESPVSLLVDEISDVLTVAAEDFAKTPENLQGISRQLIRGVYKLKNNLLLVLEINKTISVESSIIQNENNVH